MEIVWPLAPSPASASPNKAWVVHKLVNAAWQPVSQVEGNCRLPLGQCEAKAHRQADQPQRKWLTVDQNQGYSSRSAAKMSDCKATDGHGR